MSRLEGDFKEKGVKYGDDLFSLTEYNRIDRYKFHSETDKTVLFFSVSIFGGGFSDKPTRHRKNSILLFKSMSDCLAAKQSRLENLKLVALDRVKNLQLEIESVEREIMECKSIKEGETK